MTYPTLDDFLNVCNGHCYIYGAGVWGHYTLKYLLTHTTITVTAILVQSMQNNHDNLFGIPVKEMGGNMDNSCPVLIALSPNYVPEVIQELNKHGFHSIYVVTSDDYQLIRKDAPDISAETRAELHGLSKSYWGLTEKILHKTSELENKINKFEREHNKGAYGGLWRDTLWFKDSFHLLAQQPTVLEKKIFALVQNMDSDSTFEIYRIIDRLHKLVNNQSITYNKEEQRILTDATESFTNNLFKLSDNLNAYNQFLFYKSIPDITSLYYRHGLQRLKHPDRLSNKDIIDAGGYIGDSALLFSDFTRGTIYSFDADAENCNIIQKNAALNHRNQIVPIYAALTDYIGNITFYQETSGRKASGTLHAEQLGTEYEERIVPAITIDSFVEERNL